MVDKHSLVSADRFDGDRFLPAYPEPSGELDIDFALAHEDGGANLQKNE